jgi:hypothetical protein
MTRLLIFMAMALCLWQEVQGQDDPCLIFVGESLGADRCPTDAATTRPTTGQAVALKHNNITRGLSVTDSSRYRAFWIMGDGNFIPSGDHLEKSEDIKTLEINYIYSKLGSFNIYPVLIEKKSNGKPPGSDLRKTDASLPVARTADGEFIAPPPPLVKGTPFTKRLTPGNRADMLNSEKIRLGGYETALVTSTALPSSGTQQVALVFYNSLKTDRRTPFFAGTLFPIEPTVLRANYTNTVHQTGDTSILLPQLRYAANKQGYLNVLAQPIEILPDIKPDTFSEFRFFPLFKTKPKDNPNSLSYSTGIPQLDRSAQGETQFLTLVLENVIVNPDFKSGFGTQVPLLQTGQADVGSQLSAEERSRIVELLTSYFPQILEGMTPQELTDLRIHNTNIYIRGAAYRSTAIVSSIDPTSLDVLQICPKGNGQYDVSMKMTVCNEGNMPEPVVRVDIYKTNGLQVIDPKFTDVQDLYNIGYNQQDTIWEFEYHNLDGAYNAVGEYTSSCFSKPFSFTTDWAGVQLLKTRKGLTAKVHFESALILPVQFFDSEPFSPNVPVTQEYGYKCGGSDKKDNWWLYVILFALGLVAWWYWKMKKEEEAS